MNHNTLMKADGMVKKYGHVAALDHVSIEVQQGAIYGLIGDNGAGKTTFLKLLTGQIKADEGNLTMLGESHEKGYERVRRHTGVIIENPSFYPSMSVYRNMEYYRIQRGIPGKGAVQAVLREVGLLEAVNKKYKTLSLGMKQRLGLALALMGEPELLILDEPINGLDPSGIIEIRNLLLKLNQEKNITILISSHILSELQNIATHYGILKKGRLVEEITAEELQERCQSYLEIKVTDNEKYTALLEEKLGCKDYLVMPDMSIRIMEHLDRIEEYSHLATSNGLTVLHLDMRQVDLESYYIRLIQE